MAELDFNKDWQNLNDAEKLSWTIICNDRKAIEVAKFEKKHKLQSGSCNHMLEQINPLQRWYEERSRLTRAQKRIL